MSCVTSCAAAVASLSGAGAAVAADVDMPTFAAHALTPAARIIWSVNASVIDAARRPDRAPRTDGDRETGRKRRRKARGGRQRADDSRARGRCGIERLCHEACRRRRPAGAPPGP